mgnify:CR=1 FL=1
MYADAVKGNAGVPGLRSVAVKFAAADGYNLHDIDQWTPGQKRRVRDTYQKVYHLLAQEKRIVRPRSKKNLKLLQENFHGDIQSGNLKVAFIPDTDPKRLPGAKKARVKIRYTSHGIVLDRGNYRREWYAFNKRALARDPKAEIGKAIASMPTAKTFVIQTGEFQTISGLSAESVSNTVQRWMKKYDPKLNVRAKGHDYRKWLNGIHGYSFGRGIDSGKMTKAISEGREAARAKRAEANAQRDMTDDQRDKFNAAMKGAKKKGVRHDRALGAAKRTAKRKSK